MVLLQNLSARLQAEDPEERQIISGVSWQGYEALLNEFGDSLRYRVTYLDGVLELVSPSRRHERNKTIIGSQTQPEPVSLELSHLQARQTRTEKGRDRPKE